MWALRLRLCSSPLMWLRSCFGVFWRDYATHPSPLFILFVTVLCEINILRPLFQFWFLHKAFPRRCTLPTAGASFPVTLTFSKNRTVRVTPPELMLQNDAKVMTRDSSRLRPTQSSWSIRGKMSRLTSPFLSCDSFSCLDKPLMECFQTFAAHFPLM